MRVRALFIVLCATVSTVEPGVASAAPCWRPPVVGKVTDPFREPSCPYCPGNRGLEYVVTRSMTVRAVAGGEVSWSGIVAGTRYVVVRHTDGRRATYGRLTSTSLRTGDRVLAGTTVGSASGQFYFGVRVGETYVDPSSLLGRFVGRVRLVPVDGSSARPAPPPRLVCGAVDR